MYLYLLGLSSLFFVMFKVANLSIRVSDTNVYFYTAYKLLEGNVLYKDIFFTNFPLFPYLSSLYVWISRGSLEFYYATASLEAAATAFLIFFVLKKQFQDELLGLLGGISYLFSFIVLTTTDHQTGVFFLSLTATAAYYFYISRRFLLAGVCLGAAICIKAYFLPVAAAFFLFTIVKERKNIMPLLLGAVGAGSLILLPTVLFSFNDFLKNLSYSLTRSQGIDTLRIVIFFIKRDFILIVALLVTFFKAKSQLLLTLILGFCILFLFLYKDIYYLYLNFSVPFLVIAGAGWLKKYALNSEKTRTVSILVIVILAAINSYWYISSYSQIGKIEDFDGIVRSVQKAHPAFIYGEEGLATAVAYKAGVPMLDGIIDTNANIFRKKILSAKKLTDSALRERTVLVTHGAEYPSENVNERIISEVLEGERVKKRCAEIFFSPVISEDAINRITIWKCYK